MAQEQSDGKLRTRRNFLKTAVGVGGGLTVANFGGVFGIGSAEIAASDVSAIVNLAATAEALAVTLYYAVIAGATFYIGEQAIENLKLAMDAEMHHLQILQSLGGRPLTWQFHLPERMATDADVFVDTALKAETAFAGAYLAATHQLAVLGQPRLAATAAQHGASEAQHLMVMRHLAGFGPSDLTLPEPIFRQVSDALPTLAPFLKGGGGYRGPVSFPSPDSYQAAIGDTRAARARTFAQAYGAH
ncbi:MAG: ferritin-like domain-containing protein [Kouleothrix sp.]|nr:ferritin-like domain-containing protein [Kouleothrix sp.]